MIATCPVCSHHGSINDKFVPEQGRYIVCPNCKNRFFLKKPQNIQQEQTNTFPGKENFYEPDESTLDTRSADYSPSVSGEADILHLICPGCGATLEKPENLKGNTFHCEYCKNVVVIKEVSSEPKQSIQNVLELALFSEKTGDYVQAYRHYSKLIEIDPTNPTFWTGKARAAGNVTSYTNLKIDEMLNTFKHAISISEEKDKKELRKDAGEFIFRKCCDYLMALKTANLLAASKRTVKPEEMFPMTFLILNMLKKFLNIQTGHYIQSYDAFFAIQIINGLIQASEYLPYDLEIVNTIIVTCRTKLPSYGPPEISNYRKEVLNTYLEKRERLNPEYFDRKEEMNLKNLKIVNDFLLLLVAPLLFFGFFKLILWLFF